MADHDETLETLQKLVDGFPLDVGRARAALADDRTSAAARRLLVGALNYVIDTWDMVPDHYRGLGVADDALVLRVAAHRALAEGAGHRGVQQLAGEMSLVRTLLGDLVEPLEALCARLPDREVRGRKADAILADADLRAGFDADLNRLAKKLQPTEIAPAPLTAQALLGELRKTIKTALVKEGLAQP